MAMFKLYEENMDKLKKGDLSLLADTHAYSSSLKSFSTITAAAAIEECRRACGGHGYSASAGMGSQYAEYLPQVTWEGDSYMLTAQPASYLMKTFRKLAIRKKGGDVDISPDDSPTTEYLQRYLDNPTRKARVSHSGDFHDLTMYLDAFGFRAAHMVARLVRKRDEERRTWNSLQIEMFRASKAHAQYLLIYNFVQALKNDKNLESQPALHRIMQDVFELFACHTMDLEAADFLVAAYLTPQQAELVRGKIDDLLPRLRPQAVALVDSFKLPDYLLNSALGRTDGEVYRALFDFALQERES